MLSNTAQSLRLRRSGDIHSRFNLMPSRFRSPRSGFTLIELLTVIAIIGILSAITFGVVKGVNERAAIGQAKAELGTLAQALEAYKRQYGDYPRTQTASVFLQSLIGKKGPLGADLTTTKSRKTFVDVGQFTLNDTTKDAFTDTTVYLIDPWGRAYAYLYNTNTDPAVASTWVNPSYVLYSVGPNGKTYGSDTSTYNKVLGDTSKGTLRSDLETDSGSADNIYSNR